MILGFFSGLFGSLTRILDMFKTKKTLDQGRALQQADQAKREIALQRQETEILTQKLTKEDVIKKLEDGKF